MVSTRSNGTSSKQAKLEDFDVAPVERQSKTKSQPKTKSDNTTKTSPSKATDTKDPKPPTNTKKRKAHQPPTPPPVISIPSDRPEEEGRPRKVPKGSTPSDPVGAARRAAETRRKDNAKKSGQQQRLATTKNQSASNESSKAGDEHDEPKLITDDDQPTDGDEKPIMINRSPVLTLWGACVTAFLYPELSWEACLSTGAAIAALCAVSKGRAIGRIEPKEAPQSGENLTKRTPECETYLINVMHFPMQLNPSKTNVLVSGKLKPQSESNLISKFDSSEIYKSAKAAMQGALRSWKDHEEDLDGKAFGMYEKFRPEVPKGGRGWGRKGELRLGRVRQVVSRL